MLIGGLVRQLRRENVVGVFQAGLFGAQLADSCAERKLGAADGD
jgi:hypothetical protein